MFRNSCCRLQLRRCTTSRSYFLLLPGQSGEALALGLLAARDYWERQSAAWDRPPGARRWAAGRWAVDRAAADRGAVDRAAVDRAAADRQAVARRADSRRAAANYWGEST